MFCVLYFTLHYCGLVREKFVASIENGGGTKTWSQTQKFLLPMSLHSNIKFAQLEESLKRKYFQLWETCFSFCHSVVDSVMN